MMWWQEKAAPPSLPPAEAERYWANRLAHQLAAPQIRDVPFDLGVSSLDAAAVTGCNRPALMQAIRDGEVPTVFTSTAGHPRVHVGDVERWWNRRRR